jgi:hypothetical protein
MSRSDEIEVVVPGRRETFNFVMPGLVPGIHAFWAASQDVDGQA